VRVVDLTTVRASGVDYRQRRRLVEGVAPRIPVSELPPIPGLAESGESAGVGTTGSEGPPHRRGPPWTVRADRISCNLTQLWIDRFRLAGPMRVETPMSLFVHGPQEYPDVHIDMKSGALWAGDQAIFEGFDLSVRAVVHPFVGSQVHRLDLFRFLSGRFELRSTGASLFFLEPYFKKTPWVRFRDRAPGQAVLILDHGRLQPGTRFEVHNDKIHLEIIDRRFTGAGQIVGRVEERDQGLRAYVNAEMHSFQIAALAEGAEAYARGGRMTIETASDSLDLTHPFDSLHVVIDLPEAAIVDPDFYNSFIPAASGFRFISGAGTMRYHFEGSHEERSLHGDIELTVDHGVARFQSYDLRGGFRISTQLRQVDAASQLFDISGTRADLYSDHFPWKGVVRLPMARMRFATPPTLDANLHVDMQDTQPLVALFDALHGVPHWLQSMMVIPNVHATAGLATRPGHVTVNDLEVTGKGLKASGDLSLGKPKDGILYLRFHGLSLGIELKGGKRNLKIIRPRHWFDEERARRRSARRRESPSSGEDEGAAEAPPRNPR